MRLKLLFAALSFAMVSCATAVNGRYHTVSVDSFPSGAKITVHCGDVPQEPGVTPAKVRVQRAAEQCLITLTKDGYDSKLIILSHQLSRATVLNDVWGIPTAILGGMLGAMVDDAIGGDGESLAADGLQGGFALGAAGATAIDQMGGGFKWVPGRVFVTLVRSELVAESARETEP